MYKLDKTESSLLRLQAARGASIRKALDEAAGRRGTLHTGALVANTRHFRTSDGTEHSIVIHEADEASRAMTAHSLLPPEQLTERQRLVQRRERYQRHLEAQRLAAEDATPDSIDMVAPSLVAHIQSRAEAAPKGEALPPGVSKGEDHPGMVPPSLVDRIRRGKR